MQLLQRMMALRLFMILQPKLDLGARRADRAKGSSRRNLIRLGEGELPIDASQCNFGVIKHAFTRSSGIEILSIAPLDKNSRTMFQIIKL